MASDALRIVWDAPAGDAVAPRYRIHVITPDHATRLLHQRRPAARRHAGAVRAYAQAMRDGSWVLNGMPVILSRQGVLLDGVQRLLACTEANAPFETFLAEEVDDDACHTIDQQRRRSFANVLEARGVPHAHAVQTALVKLLRLDAGTIDRPDSPLPSWAVMDRVLHANPHIESAVSASLALTHCPLPEPVRTPLICMGYQRDRASTDRLLDALTRPDRYAPSEPGVRLWHEIAREREGSGQPRCTIALLALAIRALDATIRDIPLRQPSWAEPSAPEAFPRLHRDALLTIPPSDVVFDGPTAATPGFDRLQLPADRAWPKPAIGFAIEAIGPHRAAQYLDHNSGNRRISRAHVEAIARDLRQGRWMFNAQPICFARNGRLLNGQHRLRAVILAGGEIEVPVVRGLDEAVYATYDCQAKRRVVLGDKLETFGDQALAAAMANLLWRHERKTASTANAKATAAEIQQIIVQHPRLLLLRSFARKMVPFGRASVIGYAAYVMEREDAALAARFLAALESGADLRPSHPILALRSHLRNLRRAKSPQGEQLAALLAGWQRFRVHPGAA